MFIVHVFAHIKEENIEQFKIATIENAMGSLQEPGVARFDVLQQKDDPARFALVEVYKTSADPAKHKETAHYQKWRDTVADWLVEPRSKVIYDNMFPDEAGWE